MTENSITDIEVDLKTINYCQLLSWGISQSIKDWYIFCEKAVRHINNSNRVERKSSSNLRIALYHYFRSIREIILRYICIYDYLELNESVNSAISFIFQAESAFKHLKTAFTYVK